MKPNPKNHFARLITAAFTAAFLTHFFTPSAQAAALTWSGGDGDWQDAVVGGWSAPWNSATPDSGTFSGAGGTVTLLGSITTLSGTAPTTPGLSFAGTGDYTITAGSAQTITVGTGATNAVVRVAAGRTAIIGANVTLQRSAGAGGWYINNGGTLEIATGGAFIQGTTGGTEVAGGSTLRINGGTATLGGSLSVGSLTGAGGGPHANLLVDSGSLTIGGTGNLAIGRVNSENSIGTLNNGSITVSGGNLNFGTGATSSNATFNLNGGTLSVKQVTSTTNVNSTFNFNGGTLKAVSPAAATFMTGIDTARIRNGAAVIDTNGQAITIGQVLTHSAVGGDNAIDGGLNLNDSAVTKGTLSLTGANTFNGPTKITAGILSLENSLAIQSSSLDTQNSTAGDASNGLKTALAALTIGGLSGNKNLADVFTSTSGGYSGVTALTLNPGKDITLTYSGDIANGAMTLSKTGTGAQVFTAANTYTGLTTITPAVASGTTTGALIVSANNALGTVAAGTTVSPGASLGLSGGIDYTTTETVTGSGVGSGIIAGTLPALSRGLIQSVSGNNTFRGNIELSANGVSRIGTQDGASLTLTGSVTQATGITTASILFRAGTTVGDFVTLSNAGNSFGGNCTIFTGATTGYSGVRLGISNALPTNLTISGLGGGSPTAAGTALDLNGFAQSLNGLIGTNVLNIINTNTGTPSTLTLNPTADLSTAGTLVLGGTGLTGALGTINVVKDGTFSQTLSGVNTYSGTTTINAGTLLVNSPGSLDAASAVAVNSTGTLGGNGTIGGTVTVATGATIAPGASTGTLTVGNNVTLDGTYACEVDGLNKDLLSVTGNLDVTGATLAVSTIGAGATEASYVIATYTGTLSGTFIVSPALPAGYSVDYTTTGQIKLVSASNPYDTWATLKGLTGAPGSSTDPAKGADPDNDGRNNLAEFAFNGNPLSGSDNGKVYVLTEDSDFDGDAIKELILTVAVRTGTLAFTGSPSPSAVQAADGITYSIEGSLDLASFPTTINVVSPVITGLPADPGAGYEYRSFSLNGSNGLPGKGFLRAKVTSP